MNLKQQQQTDQPEALQLPASINLNKKLSSQNVSSPRQSILDDPQSLALQLDFARQTDPSQIDGDNTGLPSATYQKPIGFDDYQSGDIEIYEASNNYQSFDDRKYNQSASEAIQIKPGQIGNIYPTQTSLEEQNFEKIIKEQSKIQDSLQVSRFRSTKNSVMPLIDKVSPYANTRLAAEVEKNGSIKSLLHSNLSKEDQIDILESANIAISISQLKNRKNQIVQSNSERKSKRHKSPIQSKQPRQSKSRSRTSPFGQNNTISFSEQYMSPFNKVQSPIGNLSISIDNDAELSQEDKNLQVKVVKQQNSLGNLKFPKMKPLESEILMNLRKDRFGNFVIRKSQTKVSQAQFRKKNKIGSSAKMSEEQIQLFHQQQQRAEYLMTLYQQNADNKTTHQITFVDRVADGAQPLEAKFYVESQKEYNLKEWWQLDHKDKVQTTNITCDQICSIF